MQSSFRQISKYLLLLAIAAGSSIASAQLGSLDRDLVFTPVTPCRILDTRFATSPAGPLTAGGVRYFLAGVGSGFTNYANQGGDATNCNLPDFSRAAIAINLTVVTPATAGYITAYPAGAVQPLAATVNFNAGDVRGNLAIVKVAQTTPVGLAIFSSSQTHLVGDIVGYYARPVTTQLECIGSSAFQTVLANAEFSFSIPSCTAGYMMTGAGCQQDNTTSPSIIWALNGLGTTTTSSAACVGKNISGFNVEISGAARCCRIPGR